MCLPVHLWLACACVAVEVSLPLGPYVRPGEFVAVAVSGAGAGEHELRGSATLPVRWSGGEPVILPVLLREAVGPTLALTIDGERVDLAVQVLHTDDRLIIDATHSLSEGEIRSAGANVFPEARLLPGLASPTASPAAWRMADAVILDPARQASLLATLEQAGVMCVALGTRPGSQWHSVGEGDRLWIRPPPPSPRGWLVAPAAYEAIIGWQPGRPQGEKRALALAAVLFATTVVLATLSVKHPRRQTTILVGLGVLFGGGVVLWMMLRPEVVVRQADVMVTSATPLTAPVTWDRWLMIASPAGRTTTTKVAFVGVTYPIAFSTNHLEQLAPILHTRSDGAPLAWELALPAPAHQAAVLQRTVGDRPDPQFSDWARPLVRTLYLRQLRGATWEVAEDRAVVVTGSH